MKLWVDDVRTAPEGYIHLHSVNEVKNFIEQEEYALQVLQSDLNAIDNEIAFLPYQKDKNDVNMFELEIERDMKISQIKKHTISLIDLDHDAGEFSSDGGDYIKILDWMEETGRSYPIKIHSQNPVGVQQMKVIIERNNWYG